MNVYLLLPLIFLKFWYFESPKEIGAFFWSVNKAFLKLFSLPLFLKTYVKPLKNEYRPGLIRFSRFMGIIIKTVLILADTILFILLITFELAVLIGFLAFPVLTVWLLFW